MSGSGSGREYPARPIVGIGVLVFRGDQLLVVRRGRAPLLGEHSFPSGAQRVGETAEQAARRELAEETGVAVGRLALAGHADRIDRDPDGRVRFHYTILDFWGEWEAGEPVATGDAAAAFFADVAGLEMDGAHLAMVRAALLQRGATRG